MNCISPGGTLKDIPDFPGLHALAAVLLQVHIADLPDAPWLGHPDVLTAVTDAWYHLVYLSTRGV